MKKFIMMLAAALVLTSCAKEGDETTADNSGRDSMGQMTITFVFGPQSQTQTQTAMTRTLITDTELTDLWVFDYMDGTLSKTIHQSATDTGFGTVSVSLDYGEHTLCFVASKGTSPTIDAPVITWEKPSDTFWHQTTLNVQPSSATLQPVSLQRVASRLRIVATDVLPENAAQLIVTPSHWYYGLNIQTGAACEDRSDARTVTIPASYIGTSDKLAASFYSICSADWTADVSVKITASDTSTLGEVTLTDVGFKCNMMTVYSGGVLGSLQSAAVSVEDGWLEDEVHAW